MKRNRIKWTIISLGVATAAMLPTFVMSCGLGNSLGVKLADNTWIPQPQDQGTGPTYGTDQSSTKKYKVSIFDNWNGVKTHAQVPGINPHFQNILWATGNDSDSAFWLDLHKTTDSFKAFSQFANVNPVITDLTNLKGTKIDQIGNVQGNIQYYYQYTFDITVSQSSPYFTLASKFAPGPDWFSGVSALRLYNNGWALGSVNDLILYTTATADPRYTSGTILAPKELNTSNDGGSTNNQKFGQIIFTPV